MVSNVEDEISKSSNLKGQNVSKAKPTKVSRKRGANAAQEKEAEISKRLRLESGTLLTLGQGDMGQLGLGDEILSRKKPAIVKKLADIQMTQIAAGALHTVCLSTDNQVYSFGCNDEYALGRETGEDDENSEYFPSLVGPLSAHSLSLITAGDSHTMALTSDGKVFIWGIFRDSHGQMGMFKEREVCKSPTLLSTLKEPIVSIASGNDHVIMVSNTGKVFTMGCSEQGQLGRVARYFADRKNQRRKDSTSDTETDSHEDILLQPLLVHMPLRFKRLSADQKVTRAFAGAFTSWVLTNKDHVFAWGLNNWNQLGFPDRTSRFRPEHCSSLSGIKLKQIAGGQHHSVVLDTNGNVFSMGRGEYGRLGLSNDVTQADKLRKIDELKSIASVSACSAISFAVSSTGAAYGWGFGSNLQLTTGEEDDEWVPTQLTGRNLESKKVLQVSAGGQHTVMLVTSDPTNGDTT